ncbi:MAG TPA: hypothetical protein VLS45_04845 [Methylomicrobium sp.]|nr:hypothetical protein [Methylomicrobium sp.]
MTHTTLHLQLRLHGEDSIDEIADRLAAQYGWTTDERARHAERMLDIRRTTLMDALFDRSRVPANRDAAAISHFLSAMDEAANDAQIQLRELPDP